MMRKLSLFFIPVFLIGLWLTSATPQVNNPLPSIGFSAHKNGTDQTGIANTTLTPLTFSTLIYNTGGFFASNTWTPPAGKIQMGGATFITGTMSVGQNCLLVVAKAGANYKSVSNPNNGTASCSGTTSITDSASGADAYTLQVFITVSASTGTALGGSTVTYFWGTWLGP